MKDLTLIAFSVLLGLCLGVLWAVHDTPPPPIRHTIPATRLIPDNIIDDRVLWA